MIRIAEQFDDYLERLAKHKHLEPVVIGHALIESMMTEALTYLGMVADELTDMPFQGKVGCCVESDVLGQAQAFIFDKLNRLRNQILNINGVLDLDLLMDLYQEMKDVGYDVYFMDRKELQREELNGISEQEIISSVLFYCFVELATWLSEIEDGPYYL